MKRRMKVLSIDFDYFQKVDDTTLYFYPDGHDFGAGLSTILWASHYANPMDSKYILGVEIDTDKLDRVLRVIKDSYNPNTDVLICNSHKHIYDQIMKNYSENDFDGIDVYNLDMHPDLLNNNAGLDCGNWVSHVLDDFEDSSVTWIRNPISLDVFGGIDENKFKLITEDLSEIEYMDFDVIFLCRSDVWTPPHLDSYFIDFSYDIVEIYDEVGVTVEKGILEVRDCSEYISRMLPMFKNKKMFKGGL